MSALITSVAFSALSKEKWGRMESYNGFSGSERNKVAALQRKAILAGELSAPTQCELCLATSGRLNYHNEDYSKPLDVHPICWGCHIALHVRFTKPERWEKRKQIIRAQRVAAGVMTEDPWWEKLTLEPIDINPKHRNG